MCREAQVTLIELNRDTRKYESDTKSSNKTSAQTNKNHNPTTKTNQTRQNQQGSFVSHKGYQAEVTIVKKR